MLKAVIFDFDGTLADSRKVFVSAWNSLAEKHGFKKMKLEELEAIKKLSIKERCKLLNCPMYKIPMIIPPLYKLYRQSIDEIELYDGIKPMLDELAKRGLKTVIISSNSEENIQNFLRRRGIDTISTLLCSNKIFGKDRLLFKFLKENHLSASEVLYVGDEQRDIVACKKAGVKIIWVAWGFDALEAVESAGPDYKIYEPSQILQVVQSRLSP